MLEFFDNKGAQTDIIKVLVGPFLTNMAWVLAGASFSSLFFLLEVLMNGPIQKAYSQTSSTSSPTTSTSRNNGESSLQWSDTITKISEAAREVRWLDENLNKIKSLFAYPLPDEKDYSNCGRDLSVELGGSSTHSKFCIESRAEANSLHAVVTTILIKRKDRALFQLKKYGKMLQ